MSLKLLHYENELIRMEMRQYKDGQYKVGEYKDTCVESISYVPNQLSVLSHLDVCVTGSSCSFLVDPFSFFFSRCR